MRLLKLTSKPSHCESHLESASKSTPNGKVRMLGITPNRVPGRQSVGFGGTLVKSVGAQICVDVFSTGLLRWSAARWYLAHQQRRRNLPMKEASPAANHKIPRASDHIGKARAWVEVLKRIIQSCRRPCLTLPA